MSPERFKELTINQQITMMLAAHIRNELEDFHVEHVPDNWMPELNSTIRYAIYDFLENYLTNDRGIAWLMVMAPDCWEIAGIDPKLTFTGEYLWEGKPVRRDVEDLEN